MRASWTAASRSRRSRPPLPRLYLSHFRRRSTTSKSIGPSLGVSLDDAPCVCAIRTLATAAAASRLMTMITIGLGAARPLPTLPPDLHLPAALLAPLHPLQPDRSQPGAAASLPGRLFVGSSGALGQRSPARGRSLHAPSLVSQFGLLAAPVFPFAAHHPCSEPVAPGRGNSPSRLAAARLADSLPLSRTLLALAALRKSSRPPSLPGKTGAFLLR